MGVFTEAAKRFERGTDPNITVKALEELGENERHRRLGELRWLQVEEPQIEPAPRPALHRAEEHHRAQERGRGEIEHLFDQRKQMQAAFVNMLRIFFVSRDPDWSHDFAMRTVEEIPASRAKGAAKALGTREALASIGTP